MASTIVIREIPEKKIASTDAAQHYTILDLKFSLKRALNVRELLYSPSSYRLEL